ncbi:MAG: cobyric acid synthase [archaeon]|nr:cobyric acid synthase [archaeon]
MKCITSKINHALKVGNIHCNTCCEYYPCHYKGQNCSFCYCPFYPCEDTDLGKMISTKHGDIWDCSQCLFNHRNNVVDFSFREFKKLGITSAMDPRIKDVFIEAKKSIFRLGKCVMVFGATTDVSFVVAAMCRLLLRRDYVVTPFKLQSVYNDPRVARIGCYVSTPQNFQCKAAGLTNISMDINPILLKSKGDKAWQVVVNGKNKREYDVNDYFRNFLCELGMDIAKGSVDFLKKRYDYVIMEGLDFSLSAGIENINDVNIEVAKHVGARCILAVDIESKNFLGGALGRIEPMLENGRQEISGIILRALNKDFSNIESTVRQLEEIVKIPVIGVIPHTDIFSNESLRRFAFTNAVKTNSKKLSIIKFPEVAYLSDIDPLYLEGVAVEYATTPQDLAMTDAIVIPDTKNILVDIQWLKATGLFDSIRGMAGKVPILGICGGCQMMAKYCLADGENQLELEGLGLFDISFRKSRDGTYIAKDSAVLNLADGGKIDGYEIRTVSAENCKCAPLFMVKTLNNSIPEGFADEGKQLYGTHIHGLFEKAAFRQYFISKVYADGVDRISLDYNDYEEVSLDQLADEFFDALDVRKFWDIFERN